MRYENTNPKAIRAAEGFPVRLERVHEGRIVLRNDAIYRGAHEHINVVCTVCGHDWSPSPNNLISHKRGCPECANQRRRDSAGIQRHRAVTPEELARARQLHAEGWGPVAIGRELGRYHSTISKWLDPELRERQRQYNADHYKDKANRERKRQTGKAYLQTDHGRASNQAKDAERRALKRGWYTTDPTDKAAIKAIYAESVRLTKETGIEHHVDHIHPLSLGGAHLPFNLTIITASENCSKNSTYRPEDQILYARRLYELIKAG